MAENELFLPGVAVIPTQRDIEILFGAGDDLPMQKGGTFAHDATAGPNSDGILPSGTLVSRLSDGRYGEYHGSAPVESNESVSIAVDATGGTFTITFRGATTGNIAFNATTDAVRAALELLPEVNEGDVVVTGGPGNAGHTTPYVLTWGGQYADQDVSAVTTTATNLTGGAATAAVTTTAGAAGATDGTGTAVGVLRSSLNLSTADQLGNIVFAGRLKLDTLWNIDAAAMRDLHGRESYPNCFQF